MGSIYSKFVVMDIIDELFVSMNGPHVYTQSVESTYKYDKYVRSMKYFESADMYDIQNILYEDAEIKRLKFNDLLDKLATSYSIVLLDDELTYDIASIVDTYM